MKRNYLLLFLILLSTLTTESARADDTYIDSGQDIPEECKSYQDLGVKSNPPINMNNPERRLKRPDNAHSKQFCELQPKGEVGKKFDLLFEFDFFSKYVSKGLPGSTGFVWQPSITFEAYNAGISIWSNYVLDDEPNQGQFNEVDFTPYYSFKIWNLNFIPAVNFMVFPNKNPESLNYSSNSIIRPQWHLSYKLGYFTPYADGFYYPYPTRSWGTYHDIGVLFHYGFVKRFEIDTSVQIAIGGGKWNTKRITPSGTEVNNFEYVLSLTYNATKSFSLVPVLHVVVTLPETLRQSMDEPDFVWGGLTLKYDI